FFELLSLLALLNFWESKNKKWFYFAAISIGLAITTKLLAIGTLGIFILLFFYEGHSAGVIWKKTLKIVGLFIGIAFLIPLPWLVLALVTTGNPIYPFFSSTYSIGIPFHLLNPIYALQSFWKIFTHADDPILPLYLGILPVVLLFFKKFDRKFWVLFLYSGLS